MRMICPCTNIRNLRAATMTLMLLLVSVYGFAQLTKTGGWTNFVAGSETRIIYVSDSEGNDAAAQFYSPGDAAVGADPFKPSGTVKAYKTLEAAALQLRNGFPDWILFRRGDVFANQRFGVTTRYGKSASEPMVFGSYGESVDRPLIQTGNQGFIDLAGSSASFLAFSGLQIEPHTRLGTDEPIGIRIINAPFTDILIEDCHISQYFNNLAIHDPVSPPAATRKKLTVRRSVIADAYVTSASHANAMFIDNVDSILFEENLLDHNGWSSTISGASPTGFRHNSYFQVNCRNLDFRENIVARAAATGGGFRCGGNIFNNTFLDNPKNVQFGTHESTIDWPAVSVHGEIAYNVILGSRVTTFEAGKGITVQRARNTDVHHNIIAHFEEVSDYNLGLFFTESGDIDIRNNIVYNWGNNLAAGPAYSAGIAIGSVLEGINTLDSNDVQIHNIKGRCVINNGLFSNLLFSNNRYYSQTATGEWFEPGGSFQGWQSLSGDSNSAAEEVGYTDPERDAATYLTSIGKSGGLEEFLELRRAMSKGNWNSLISAASFNNYIRLGFDAGTLTAVIGQDEFADKNLLLQCYPNPFNTMIHIRFSPQAASPLSIDIYDMNGRKVLKYCEDARFLNDISLDTRHLASGLYYAVLRAGGSMKVEKLVKVQASF